MTAFAMNNVWMWIVILVVVLLLFGAPKLPALAKSLGQSLRIFQKEMKSMDDSAETKGEASEAESKSKDA